MIFWQNLQIISSCGVDFKSSHRTISCPIAAMPLFDLWHLSWKVNIEGYGIHSHNEPLVTFLPTRRIARVCVLFVSSLWLFLFGWLTEFLFLLFCFALFVCFILVFFPLGSSGASLHNDKNYILYLVLLFLCLLSLSFQKQCSDKQGNPRNFPF